MNSPTSSWPLATPTRWRRLVALAAAASLGLLAAACSSDDIPTRESAPAVLPGATNPNNDGGLCLEADATNAGLTSGGVPLNCTANDVDYAIGHVEWYALSQPTGHAPGSTWIALPAGGRIECSAGQTIWVDADAVIRNDANHRYDMGFWLDLVPGGADALTGASCEHYNLTNAASFDIDGDLCGDSHQGESVHFDLGPLELTCADPDGNGVLDLDYCSAWQNQSTRYCPAGGTAAVNYRWGTTPETKSKCACGQLPLPVDIKARLRLVKATVPAGNPADFDFYMNTEWVASLSDGDAPYVSGMLSPGTYTVEEGRPVSWEITNRECFLTNTPATAKAFTPLTTGLSLNLLAGEDVTCRFTNTKWATVLIRKISVGGIGTFPFVGTGSGLSNFELVTTTDGVPITSLPFAISPAQLGIKYVQETLPAGWTLTGIACTANGATVVIGRGGSGAFGDGGSAAFENGDNTVKLTVAAGNEPTCTFTNTKNASLDIEKVSVGGVGGFDFVTTGTGLSNFTRTTVTSGTPTATAPIALTGLELGMKYIQETVPAGYALTGISCAAGGGAPFVIGRGGSGGWSTGGTNGFDPGDNTLRIDIGAGDSPACTFTNTRVATIDIEKVSIGGVGGFDFVGTGSGLSNFTRTTATAGTPTASDPYPITPDQFATDKYVQETAPAGWTLTGIACTAGGGTVVIGRGGSGAFGDGGSAGFESGDNTVKLTVGAGNTPACTFTNTKHASLDIEKVSLGGVGSFDFVATGTGLSNFSRATLTAGTATATAPLELTGTQLGDKYVQETVPAGWTLTGISCTGGGATVLIGSGGSGGFAQGASAGFDPGDNTVKVAVAAGNTPSCTFTNSRNASLAIQKQTVGATGLFSYVGTGTAIPANFSRNTGTANPTAEAAFPIDGFQFGDKYVQETVPAGYAVTNIACTANGATVVIGRGGSGGWSTGGSTGFDAGDNTVKVTVAAGNTPTCTFTNSELGTIIVEKEVLGGGSEIFTFMRRLSAGTLDLGDNPDPNLANGQSVSSGKKLLPGTYRVCETNLPAGYINPTAAGYAMTESSSGTFCTEVSLAAGQTVTVHVVNQLPPGGGTRTIGYWKNWSTCTNGRQAEQAYARNMPGLLLDTYLNGSGYYGGIYPIGLIVGMDAQPDLTCIQAVRLLSKDAIDGTRRPGDPVYNLVAQLLGAKLNLAAGAGTCATLTTALSQAHTLLTALGFDGTGAYRGTLTPEQQAQANALASTFTAYNEGTLGGGCPMHQ